MAQIVFAAPGIARYHLHERLHRELLRSGHRVRVLEPEPTAALFWRAQGLAPETLSRGAAGDAGLAPLDEFAARAGRPGTRAFRRAHAALAAWTPAVMQWFAAERPDAVLLHQHRGPWQALLQFAANAAGAAVLWTGDGLLPHTLQFDHRGLDGDAAACGRTALDYRNVIAETSLLQACLANLLGGAAPCALARRPVIAPARGERLHLAARCLAAGDLAGTRGALTGWRRALEPRCLPAEECDLPEAPFVAVLLQDAADPRVRLDAHDPPDAAALVAAARDAAAGLDGNLHLAIVAPARGLSTALHRALATRPRTRLLPPTAAGPAAVLATAVVTINHPLAAAGLLAGTPVLHAGRALYGLPGVTTQTPVAGFRGALPAAIAADHSTLRARFLTTLLSQGHLWCSAERPDHNGLLGLVQAVEARLGRGARPPRRPYRAGPAWPLAADGRGS